MREAQMFFVLKQKNNDIDVNYNAIKTVISIYIQPTKC